MVAEDEWLRSAMSEDRVVADLLLRLKHHNSTSSPSLSSSSSASLAKATSSSLPPPRWGIRLPRSRMAFRFDAVASSSPEKTIPDFARNSPTTPLAWSTGGRGGGGASSSGTANGSDESALPVFRPSESRSKVVCTDEPRNADAKRSKRKKTFAELREKEVSLLKERLHLNKEIATLRTTFKEHTARNEDLKRMKLGLNLNATNGPIIAPNEKRGSALEKDYTVPIDRTPPTSQNTRRTVRSSPPVQESVSVEEPEGRFLLPDLNMTPSESDFPT